MNIKVLKSWTLRVAVFGLLINEPVLSHAFEISQDANVSSPITTLEDHKPLPPRPIVIQQDKTVLSLITTLREIDNTEIQSPYKGCSYDSDFSIFDDNCELKEKEELLTYISEEEFEKTVQYLSSNENIPAIAYLSEKEFVRLKETLEKLIELETRSVFTLTSLLQNESQLLRESAIYALSEITRSSEFARPYIEELLLEVFANDDSPAVRDSAAVALAQIQPLPEVIDSLIKTLFDNRKPTGVRKHVGHLLNEISLKNISSESVKFLVEETNKLVSDSVFLGVLNLNVEREYCASIEGIVSNPHVASILSQDEMYRPWETCGILEDDRLTVSQLYELIRTWWPIGG